MKRVNEVGATNLAVWDELRRQLTDRAYLVVHENVGYKVDGPLWGFLFHFVQESVASPAKTHMKRTS